MMKLDEAKKIAEKAAGRALDMYSEYEDAFVFGSKEAEAAKGGEFSPVVVMKDTKKAMSMIWYVTNSDHAGDEPISEGDC